MANIITPQIIDKFLSEAPELKKHLNQTKVELEPRNPNPFNYLLRSIIFQQLSGKAAETIYGRFLELVAPVSPASLLIFKEKELRDVGLSRQKAGYVLNVARAFQQGGNLSSYNSVEKLKGLSNSEIINLFTQIKGVGEWTVQMYLMFGLGRLNIFAAKDLGVRKGLEIIYELDETPTPKEAKELTKHWKSYPSVGSILCWRIQD